MVLFPSGFRNSGDIARLLYYSAIWSGGRTSEVRVQGFNTLRTHVSEIIRSPSSGRIRELSRTLNLLPGIGSASIYLPPDIASDLFRVCLEEASALLELGYPRDEPVRITTSLPPPSRNSIRTVHQIRSAVHHLGGDFELLKTLIRTGGSTDGSLEVTFSVWPPQRIREESFVLRPGFRGQSVPSVMILHRRLLGYVILCCWDLALRLRDAENLPLLQPDFNSFASSVAEELRKS